MTNTPDQNKVRSSLRFSILDGIFACGMTGFTQDYLTPFVLLLGASAKSVGLLSALPNLFSSIVQLQSADMVERVRSRKRIINIFVFLQVLTLIPMVAIALTGTAKPIIFIGLVMLFSACGAFATPAWGSLMSDLVPENQRGAFFGWRNKVLGFVTVAAAFLAGIILHIMKGVHIFWGFALIFGLAAIFRLISWYFLGRMYEPPTIYHKEHYFTFVDFLARTKESNFAKFVLFSALLNFSVYMASPFFAVFMLRDLHFSYLLYTAITITATLTIYLTISRWGRHADKIGNLKIMKFTAPLTGIIPLLWLFNHHPVWLFFAQIFSGFVWAGFNLCASNFIYDAVSPPKRTRCIAYFNVVNGMALCMGALIGGFLVQILPPLFGNKILMLFLISATLRTTVGFFIPRKIQEVRHVQRVGNNELFFSIIGIKPILGVERKTIRFL